VDANGGDVNWLCHIKIGGIMRIVPLTMILLVTCFSFNSQAERIYVYRTHSAVCSSGNFDPDSLGLFFQFGVIAPVGSQFSIGVVKAAVKELKGSANVKTVSLLETQNSGVLSVVFKGMQRGMPCIDSAGEAILTIAFKQEYYLGQ
jgi:hypothetical protein